MSAMTAMTAAPGTEDLEVMFGDVWSSYIGEVEGLLPCIEGPPAAPDWTAAVSITGGSRGLVIIELADPAALAVTAGMLGLDESDLPTPGELTDAVGELANIVGGNIKSLLPGPSALSLPLVASGPIVPSSDLSPVSELSLSWHGASLRIRLLLAEEQPAVNRRTEPHPTHLDALEETP